MNITKKEVIHVAGLARLNLNSGEVDSMTKHLDDILSYVAKLEELDTSGIQPTTHALAIQNIFREDEVRPSLDHDAALANAPRHNDEAFVVPKII